MLQLSDAIVIVVIIVLLYYVLFKKECFDPKADIFPDYYPHGWADQPLGWRLNWVRKWAEVLDNDKRTLVNKAMAEYAIKYYKGRLSARENFGKPVKFPRDDFWRLLKDIKVSQVKLPGLVQLKR